jgi:tetratricopeptide (TPR) repeat protein
MNRKGCPVVPSMALGLLLLGLTPLLRAQDAPDNQTLTPYGTAVLDYKTDRYKDALTAIDEAESEKPGDPATAILKARILTELKDFDGAKKALEGLNGNPALTPELGEARTMAFGDMCLRERRFDEAAKFYESLLSEKPGDPDLILKIVYTRVGASDFVEAQRYASRLTPFDSKNPYDDHASYYFAKAAIAQATGNAQEADDAIQAARTNYGITVTNRYLKTYLEVFAPSAKNTDITPPPLVKPATP